MIQEKCLKGKPKYSQLIMRKIIKRIIHSTTLRSIFQQILMEQINHSIERKQHLRFIGYWPLILMFSLAISSIALCAQQRAALTRELNQ